MTPPLDRRTFLSILGGTLGTLLCPGSPADSAKRPNVLFIAVDDLRPELGCYGNTVVKSPNIDRLAARGMVFNRAYCQQAVCSPSRSSLLTGTRPDTTKVWDLKTHFRKALPDVVTLPQLFKNNGYFAQGMGKIYHVGYDDPVSWSVPWAAPKPASMSELQSQDPDAPPAVKKFRDSKEGRGPAFRAVDLADNELYDGMLAEMAVTALNGVKDRQEPFFLAVGFIKPHLPFVSPKKYWDLYDPAAIPPAPNRFLPKDAPPYAFADKNELWKYDGVPDVSHLPDDYARRLKHGYYAAVSYMDAQVGRVLDALDASGQRDNTIIVLWGDHGWKLGEHDRWCKHSNAENDTNAPLIISAPGMKHPGGRTDALVEFVDVYPTLAELASLTLPGHLEGTSSVPLLDQPDRRWKPAAFSQYPRKAGGKDLMGYTMRTDRYRFTRWVRRNNHEKVDAVELYDHKTDPQENVNIAGDPANAALVATLTKQWLAGWKGAAKPDAV